MEPNYKYQPLQISDLDRRRKWREKCVLTPLPPSFLRIQAPQLANDERISELRTTVPLSGGASNQVNISSGGQQIHTRLMITVVEAKLNKSKSYGIWSRLNPYCRLRLGHDLFTTRQSPSSGKNPKWQETFNCVLRPGVTRLTAEIYDSRTLSADVLLAHSTLELPTRVLNSTGVMDDWWPLCGQDGGEKEGDLHLVLSSQSVVAPPTLYRIPPPLHGQPIYMPSRPAPTNLSPGDLSYLKEMFPGLEASIIISTYQQSGGNKEATIDTLLSMSRHLI